MTNGASYNDLKLILGSSNFNIPNQLKRTVVFFKLNLPLIPNPGKSGEPGEPNPANIKIYLGNFEYILLNIHVECSDQQMGAVHPVLSSMDFKLMKVSSPGGLVR